MSEHNDDWLMDGVVKVLVLTTIALSWFTAVYFVAGSAQ